MEAGRESWNKMKRICETVPARFNKTLFTLYEFNFLHQQMLRDGTGSGYKTYKTVKRKRGFDLNVNEIMFVKSQYNKWEDGRRIQTMPARDNRITPENTQD